MSGLSLNFNVRIETIAMYVVYAIYVIYDNIVAMSHVYLVNLA